MWQSLQRAAVLMSYKGAHANESPDIVNLKRKRTDDECVAAEGLCQLQSHTLVLNFSRSRFEVLRWLQYQMQINGQNFVGTTSLEVDRLLAYIHREFARKFKTLSVRQFLKNFTEEDKAALGALRTLFNQAVLADIRNKNVDNKVDDVIVLYINRLLTNMEEDISDLIAMPEAHSAEFTSALANELEHFAPLKDLENRLVDILEKARLRQLQLHNPTNDVDQVLSQEEIRFLKDTLKVNGVALKRDGTIMSREYFFEVIKSKVYRIDKRYCYR